MKAPAGRVPASQTAIPETKQRRHMRDLHRLSVQLALGLGLIHAKRIEFRDLMQESFLRRDRNHHTAIHKQNRLTKLQVPGSKRKSLALERRDGKIRALEEIEHRFAITC